MIDSSARKKNQKTRRRRRIVGILKPVAVTGSPLRCTKGDRARSGGRFSFAFRGKIFSPKGETLVQIRENGEHSAPVVDVNSSPGTWKSNEHGQPAIDRLLTLLRGSNKKWFALCIYSLLSRVSFIFSFSFFYPPPLSSI